MKKIILFISLFLSGSLAGIECDPIFREAILSIQSLPEGQQAITHAELKGKIRVVRSQSGQFEAYWDGSGRKIMVNQHKNPSKGALICSILFELHNAQTDTELKNLQRMARQKRIPRNEFVLEMERIEHQNALRTCEILEKGIREGIFPVEARWQIAEDFDSHYRTQVAAGHAGYHGRSYDRLVRG